MADEENIQNDISNRITLESNPRKTTKPILKFQKSLLFLSFPVFWLIFRLVFWEKSKSAQFERWSANFFFWGAWLIFRFSENFKKTLFSRNQSNSSLIMTYNRWSFFLFEYFNSSLCICLQNASIQTKRRNDLGPTLSHQRRTWKLKIEWNAIDEEALNKLWRWIRSGK